MYAVAPPTARHASHVLVAATGRMYGGRLLGTSTVSHRTWILAVASFACAAALHVARDSGLSASGQVVVGNLVIILPVGVVTVSAAWAAMRYARGEPVQRQWLLVALGLGCFELGALVRAFYEIALGKAAPYPGITDVLFLLWYPIIGLALILAIRSMAGFFDVVRPLAISFGISAAAAVAMWYFVLRPASSTGAQDVLVATLNTVHPLAALLILMPLAMTLAALAERFSGGRLALPWRWLVLGIGVLVIADAGFMVLSAAWAYTTGSISDLFQALGYTLVGVSALIAADVHQPHRPVEKAA